MKKVVSLLVTVAIIFGVNAVVFAADNDIGGTTGNGVTGTTGDETGTTGFGSRSLLSDPNTRISYGYSPDTITLARHELLIVENNATNAIILPETNLEPGNEYEFKIFYSNDNQTINVGEAGNITELKYSDLAGGKLRLRGVKGTSTISSAKVNRKGSGNNSTYRLVLNTKENWSTKRTDVEYSLSITGQTATGAIPFAQGNLTFQVGYGRFTDEEIDAFGEGDIVTISNDYPVILKEHFTTLAKANNYRAVQFEADDGMWGYLGRVSGMGDTNFKYTRDVVPAIVEKFEDQEFEFLTFGAGVTFPTNGEMRIDASDFSDDFTTIYTYLYRDGKLTPINTTYDSTADEIVFRTNYLGSFVMTNEQITDTTIINTEQPPAVTEEVPTTPILPENPATGATSAVNIAVILGVASLAAAGSVVRKRK